MIHDIAGIDYGRGMSNVDFKTGIRYGIINLSDVCPYFLDEFEPQYPEIETDDPAEYDDFIDGIEPVCFIYQQENLFCEYTINSPYLWVYHSPVVVECKFCSPCFPGAGNLNSPIPGGIQAYGLPNDCLYNEEK